MDKKDISIVASSIMLSFSSSGYALGLGQVDIESFLFERLQAKIEVTGLNQEQLQESWVSVTDINSPNGSNNFKTRLGFGPNGKPYLFIKSERYIREPILLLNIQIVNRGTQITREYGLLIDPSKTTQISQRLPEPLPTNQPMKKTNNTTLPLNTPTKKSHTNQLNSRPTVAKTSLADNRDNYQYGPIKRGESLWSIAARIAENTGISHQLTMNAIFDNNPQAFINHKAALLREGAILNFSFINNAEPLTKERKVNTTNSTATIDKDTETQTTANSTSRNEAEHGTADKTTTANTKESGLSALTLRTQKTETSLQHQIATIVAADDSVQRENNRLKSKIEATAKLLTKLEASIRKKDEQIAEISALIARSQQIKTAPKIAHAKEKTRSFVSEIMLLVVVIGLAIIAGINTFARFQVKQKHRKTTDYDNALNLQDKTESYPVKNQYDNIRNNLSGIETLLEQTYQTLQAERSRNIDDPKMGLFYSKLVNTLENLNNYRQNKTAAQKTTLSNQASEQTEENLDDAFEALGAAANKDEQQKVS